jgi:hypothetical protein
MNRTSQKGIISLVLTLFSFFACAKEGMPPGGAEDTTAPEVVTASPISGATEVPLKSKIEIIFSEAMEPRTTEEAIFISPLPKEPFELKWKGKKLIITPLNPLYPDRTYVISIGADAQDLRRNRLGRTYTFAFSTGSRLDFGTISGQVWISQQIGFEREAGASVCAYLMDQAGLEIDPAIRKPDYVTQTDDEGIYLLKNLGLGTYRLFAFQDLNRDLIWNWEKEAIGLTTGDIRLTEQEVSANNVDLLLGMKDKKNPSLLNCYSLSKSSIRLEFDEELDETSALDAANYRISSPVSKAEIAVKCSYFEDQDLRKIILQTEQMVPHQEYDIITHNINDKTGNPVDTSSNICRITAIDPPDTVGPKIISIRPTNGQTEVPSNTPITIVFDEPPDHQSLETSFLLADSTNKMISGKGEWVNPNVYLFSPGLPLPSFARFQIRLQGRGIYDQMGNPSGLDSVFLSSFVTLNQEDLGSVSGTVEVEGRAEVPNIILTLWHLQQKDILYHLALKQPGSFKFGAVLPGKYFLGSFLDLDTNRILSFGNPVPFSPIEPFKVYADTIYVRSRWETEGVKMEFKGVLQGE